MKKLLLFILTLTLFLSGCSPKKALSLNKKSDFELIATCKQADIKSEANIKCSGAIITVTYTYPKCLDGLTFIFDGDLGTVKYMGLEIKEENLNILKSTCPEVIAKSLQDSMSKFGKEINGSTEYGNYTIKIDQSTGVPSELNVPNKKLNCTFKLK